jgi:hypothetical protein
MLRFAQPIDRPAANRPSTKRERRRRILAARHTAPAEGVPSLASAPLVNARINYDNNGTFLRTGAAATLRASATKRPDLLPPCTTGSVRIRSNLDVKLGRAIGGLQWRAADRRCASRYGHSSRGASGLGVAFVGALCRRIDSQGVDPRSLNWKISSPGKARDRSPAPCSIASAFWALYRAPALRRCGS